MSRSGYSDDLDMWTLIRYRGVVASAVRGKRGQEFFRALLAALDAMPDKRLGADSESMVDRDGCACALGALDRHNGNDPTRLDPHDSETLGATFNIANQLACEVMYENDEGGHWNEGPEKRWTRMRQWAASQIKDQK